MSTFLYTNLFLSKSHCIQLYSISLNHLVSHTLIQDSSLPFIFKLSHFFPYSQHYLEHDKSHFVQWLLLLHPHRTPSINTWSLSLQVFLQNNPKFTHSVPSLNFIYISRAPRQHYEEPNCICSISNQGKSTELQSSCAAGPARNSDPIPWDQRFCGTQGTQGWGTVECGLYHENGTILNLQRE